MINTPDLIGILPELLPEAERPQAGHINTLLGGLDICNRRYGNSIELMRFARQRHDSAYTEYRSLKTSIHNTENYISKLAALREVRRQQETSSIDWQMAGVREAIMSAQDFSIYLKAIRRAVRECPTIYDLVDNLEYKSAKEHFDEYFKDIRLIRNVISHQAEEIYTLEKMDAYLGDRVEPIQGLSYRNYSNLFISIGFNIRGETATWSNDGETAHIKLDAKSVDIMRSTCDRIVLNFMGARDKQLVAMSKQMGIIPDEG